MNKVPPTLRLMATLDTETYTRIQRTGEALLKVPQLAMLVSGRSRLISRTPQDGCYEVVFEIVSERLISRQDQIYHLAHCLTAGGTNGQQKT